MGRPFIVEFDSTPVTVNQYHYRCRNCYFREGELQNSISNITHVAFKKDIVQEQFIPDRKYISLELRNEVVRRRILGKNHKPGHFFTQVVNVAFGEPVVQDYLRKPGIMADMYCNRCYMHIGWKIIKSFKLKYKFLEGLYVLDRTKIDRWLDQVREETYDLRRNVVCG